MVIGSHTAIDNGAHPRMAGSLCFGPFRNRRAAQLVLLAICSLMTFSAAAQQCPGGNTTATANFYGMGSAGVGMGAGMALFDLIGAGGCT